MRVISTQELAHKAVYILRGSSWPASNPDGWLFYFSCDRWMLSLWPLGSRTDQARCLQLALTLKPSLPPQNSCQFRGGCQRYQAILWKIFGQDTNDSTSLSFHRRIWFRSFQVSRRTCRDLRFRNSRWASLCWHQSELIWWLSWSPCWISEWACGWWSPANLGELVPLWHCCLY